jgi:hypothetical protein
MFAASYSADAVATVQTLTKLKYAPRALLHPTALKGPAMCNAHQSRTRPGDAHPHDRVADR